MAVIRRRKARTDLAKGVPVVYSTNYFEEGRTLIIRVDGVLLKVPFVEARRMFGDIQSVLAEDQSREAR